MQNDGLSRIWFRRKVLFQKIKFSAFSIGFHPKITSSTCFSTKKRAMVSW